MILLGKRDSTEYVAACAKGLLDAEKKGWLIVT
jgi:hypothetical protein